MMPLRRCALLVLLLGGLLSGACNPEPKSPDQVSQLPAQAASGSFLIVEAGPDFTLRHQENSEFESAAPGQSVQGLRQIRTGKSPAELSLIEQGEEKAKLWLDKESTVTLGQGAAGELFIEINRGQARLRSYDQVETRWLHQGEAVDLTSTDVVLRALQSEDAELISVPEQPGAAAFSLPQSRNDPAELGQLTTPLPGGGDAPIELSQVSIKVNPLGHQALVEVEHVFKNSLKRDIEGLFRFPLPRGGALVGLAMDVEGKMMEGELVERQKAREVYESIVDSMRDPALVEWEAGNVFKLRIFPVLAGKEKRVIVRYLVPAEWREDGRAQFSFQLGDTPLRQEGPSIQVQYAGKELQLSRHLSESGHLVFPASKATKVVTQNYKDSQFASGVFFAPQLSEKKKNSPQAIRKRQVLFLLDTSRSALESRKLQSQALSRALASLSPTDLVKIAVTDLRVTEVTPTWSEPALALELAQSFLENREADGASDLSAALRYAKSQERLRGHKKASFEVIYLGDATATWGEKKPELLADMATDIQAPLSIVTLGKGPSHSLIGRLVAATGGRTVRPQSLEQVHMWARQVALSSDSERLVELSIEQPDGVNIYPKGSVSLLPGEALPFVLKTAPGKALPQSVVLRGQFQGVHKSFTVSLKDAARAPHVRSRFYAEKLEDLTLQGGKKPEIIETSLLSGVMSRHTAFLVLENEEAYKQHGIERRKREDANPQVTGGDLESLGERSASLSPHRLQPGDPEVRIPAPEDAVSVRVFFPFGESKEAVWEDELKLWSVRFLVAESTDDGLYPVTVRIEHANGRIEMLKLSYTVDTKAPKMRFTLKRRGGRLLLEGIQVATAQDRRLTHRQLADAQVGPAAPLLDARAHFHRFGKDAKRAEVSLADGSVKSAIPILLAHFRVELPTNMEAQEVRFMVWDRAGNLKDTRLLVKPSSLEVTVLTSEEHVTGGLN